MKASLKAPKARVSENTPRQAEQGAACAEAIDPSTGRPVVRDLRFHGFVAHQHELYFAHNDRDH